MAGTAGRVEHRDGKKGGYGIVGLGLDAVQDRVERTVEQRLHQCVGRVVATGRLAGVALGLARLGKAKPRPSSTSNGVSSSKLS